MPQNLLVTGANGQLGNEMQRIVVANPGVVNATFTDVDTLDITDAAAVRAFIEHHSIDVIVNCAAYTAVDRAEDDMVLCAKLNIEAVANLASAAHDFGAKVLHISTDYVFDGFGHRPYEETDEPNPRSTYGITKLQGERELLKYAPDSIIVRTAWLYSPFGKNFVKTMLSLGESRDKLSVVFDQVGTPTAAADLAAAIFTIITAEQWKPGIYHFSNEGAISWYDFTKAIHRIAGITDCEVSPIKSKDYPTRAVRPFYSVLDKSKIKATFGITIPYWEESLARCIAELKTNQ
ncbi:MAG: dTDP-4-dehydrorhamnose reductase [Muribaculaceae bacterium]